MNIICMFYVNCVWNNIVSYSYCNFGWFIWAYLDKNPVLRVTSILIYVKSAWYGTMTELVFKLYNVMP